MKQNKNDYIILMGDIIKSSEQNQALLMSDFQEVIQSINSKYADKLLSPLTITLGDEFQGIIKNPTVAVALIIDLEEMILKTHKSLKIRYVCHEGTIETPINPSIAHGMLGSGLTYARKQIEYLKKAKKRFAFSLKDDNLSNIYNNAFIVFDAILQHWKADDVPIVTLFLEGLDYKAVANKLNKNRSLLWKREKNLRLEEYFSIKYILKIL